MSDVIDKIVKDHFKHYDETYYEYMRKAYPYMGKEWIAEIEIKKRIADALIRLRHSGVSHKKIAEKLDAPYKLVLKLSKDIYPKYHNLLHDNAHAVRQVAGDIRTPQQIDDYNYMNDPRTIKTEMHVLLPRIDEIRSLLSD